MKMMGDYAMVALFVVYGVTFFVMAFVVWRRLEQTSRMGIAAPMFLLVVFAVLHGSSDIVDVFLRLPGADASPISGLAAIRMVLLLASFVFLFMYGLAGLFDDVQVMRTISLLGTLAMFGALSGLTALFAEGAAAGSILEVERATRLFVALPGGLLAAAALFRASRVCGRLGIERCQRGARLAAAGMTAYAIFAGAFATGYPQSLRLLGLPIQAYRMSAALVVTLGLVMMLDRMSLSVAERSSDNA